MIVDYQSKLNRSQQMFNQSIHWLGDILIDLYLFLMLFLLLALSGCNSKPVVLRPINSYFSINANLLNIDVSVLQDSIEKYAVVVYVTDSVSFEGKLSASPDKDLWYLDGKLLKDGKARFKYQFDVPGYYQIKHCQGLYDCAIRYVSVQETLPVVEPVPEQAVIVSEETPEVKKGTRPGNGGKPPTPAVDTTSPPPPPPPPPIVKPPESFKNSAITGLSFGSYKADCALWTDNAMIKLKPEDWCELHSAIVFGNAPGKLRITLTDGKKVNESMTVTLNAGKTSFSFAGLEALLQPGVEYTLKISTLEENKNTRPKIGNASACSPGNAKGAHLLTVNYGADYSLFDLKYKY